MGSAPSRRCFILLTFEKLMNEDCREITTAPCGEHRVRPVALNQDSEQNWTARRLSDVVGCNGSRSRSVASSKTRTASALPPRWGRSCSNRSLERIEYESLNEPEH